MTFNVKFWENVQKKRQKIWLLKQMFLLLQRETNDIAGWSSW